MRDTERDWLEGNDARTQYEREVEARTTNPSDDAWQEFLREYGDGKREPVTTDEDLFKAGYRRALEDAEYRVIAEMVCCHIYEEAGQHPEGRGAWMEENKARYRNHDLCYWAGACASLLRDRAAGVGTKDGDDDE